MNPFMREGESPDTPFFAWADFPRVCSALSDPARERLLLAITLEQACCRAAPMPGGESARERAVLTRAIQADALYLGALLPMCAPVESAVRLEQAQADLTAALYALPGTRAVRFALAFTLVEDADHLYRFANLADIEQARPAEAMTGGRCEIAPGRSAFLAHRPPRDIPATPLPPATTPRAARMAALLMALMKRRTAALYMQAAAAAQPNARPLFAETALLEGQHEALYESLGDWQDLVLERWAACYLFASMAEAETEAVLKPVWARLLERKIGQLRWAAELRGESWVDGAFPPPLSLGDHCDHSALCRTLLPDQAGLTQLRGLIVPCAQLPADCASRQWRRAICGDGECLPSHRAVTRYIRRYGTDYRLERRPSPLERLHDRRHDQLLPVRMPDS